MIKKKALRDQNKREKIEGKTERDRDRQREKWGAGEREELESLGTANMRYLRRPYLKLVINVDIIAN